MITPYNDGDIRDLRAWAKAFPTANGASEVAAWVATYDEQQARIIKLEAALREIVAWDSADRYDPLSSLKAIAEIALRGRETA